MEIDNLPTKEDVMSMITGFYQPLSMRVFDNCGHVNIPIHQDELFRTILLHYLQNNIPHTDQLDHEVMVDQIMLQFRQSGGDWRRTVYLDNADSLQYAMEQIQNSFYNPKERVQTKLIFHPFPSWVIDLLMSNISNFEISKNTLRCCIGAHIYTIKDEKDAIDQGFIKEYELYTTIVNQVVDRVYNTLHDRAFKQYLKDPNTYEPVKYSTCDDFLNPRISKALRERYDHNNNTCYLMIVIMEELQLTSDDIEYYSVVKGITHLLYTRVQKTKWDYRYFKTEVESNTKSSF